MKTGTLGQLLRDRADKRMVVLATDLATGGQRLIYPMEAGDTADEVTAAALAAVQSDKSRTIETAGGERWFLQVHNPPLRMLIVGAVHIAQPLSRMAALAAYDVTVVDPRHAFATADRFPGVRLMDEWPDDALKSLQPDRRTAVVTLTHDPKLDDPALAAALRSDAFYIGALGSSRTHAKRLQRLEREGFTAADFQRIHGPVGLDIGAKSPAEIALSVMAQVTERLRRPLPSKEMAA